MTTFSVYSDGSLRRAERQMDDDLPVHVDDTTTVRLSNDNEIVISQGDRPALEHVTSSCATSRR